MASEEAQLAVLTAILGEVRAQLARVIEEQEDTNTRLAKLESWRAFVLGLTAAVGTAVGWGLHYIGGGK